MPDFIKCNFVNVVQGKEDVKEIVKTIKALENTIYTLKSYSSTDAIFCNHPELKLTIYELQDMVQKLKKFTGVPNIKID